MTEVTSVMGEWGGKLEQGKEDEGTGMRVQKGQILVLNKAVIEGLTQKKIFE